MSRMLISRANILSGRYIKSVEATQKPNTLLLKNKPTKIQINLPYVIDQSEVSRFECKPNAGHSKDRPSLSCNTPRVP